MIWVEQRGRMQMQRPSTKFDAKSEQAKFGGSGQWGACSIHVELLPLVKIQQQVTVSETPLTAFFELPMQALRSSLA